MGCTSHSRYHIWLWSSIPSWTPKGCKGHLGMCSFVADKPTPTSLSPSVCLSVCLPACLSFFLSPGLWAGIPQPAHCPRPRLSLSLSLCLLACLLACLGVLGRTPGPEANPISVRAGSLFSLSLLEPKESLQMASLELQTWTPIKLCKPRPQICVGSQAGNQKENSRWLKMLKHPLAFYPSVEILPARSAEECQSEQHHQQPWILGYLQGFSELYTGFGLWDSTGLNAVEFWPSRAGVLGFVGFR